MSRTTKTDLAGSDATPTDPARLEMIPEEWRGHAHVLHEITIEWPKTKRITHIYRIIRDDGEVIGQVSGAVSWDRIQSLICRYYSPETERIPPEGITFTGTVRILSRPDPGNDKKPYESWYIAIPSATVRRWRILQDDEVTIQIGDARPTSTGTYYHVSKMGGTMVIMLSKLERRERCSDGGRIVHPNLPDPGEYATVRIRAHPGTGRRDLGDTEGTLMVARIVGAEITHPTLWKATRRDVSRTERYIDGKETSGGPRPPE